MRITISVILIFVFITVQAQTKEHLEKWYNDFNRQMTEESKTFEKLRSGESVKDLSGIEYSYKVRKMHLFSDRFFKPHFGVPFEKVNPKTRKKMYKLTVKYRKKGAEWAKDVYDAGFGNIEVTNYNIQQIRNSRKRLEDQMLKVQNGRYNRYDLRSDRLLRKFDDDRFLLVSEKAAWRKLLKDNSNNIVLNDIKRRLENPDETYESLRNFMTRSDVDRLRITEGEGVEIIAAYKEKFDKLWRIHQNEEKAMIQDDIARIKQMSPEEIYPLISYPSVEKRQNLRIYSRYKTWSRGPFQRIERAARKAFNEKIEANYPNILSRIKVAKTDTQLYNMFYGVSSSKTARSIIAEIRKKRQELKEKGVLPAHIRDYMCTKCLGSIYLDALYRGDFSKLDRGIGFRKTHQVFFESQSSFFQNELPKEYQKVSFGVSVHSGSVLRNSADYTFYISPLNVKDYENNIVAEDYKLISSRQYYTQAPKDLFKKCQKINHPVLKRIRANFHRFINQMEPLKLQ